MVFDKTFEHGEQLKKALDKDELHAALDALRKSPPQRVTAVTTNVGPAPGNDDCTITLYPCPTSPFDGVSDAAARTQRVAVAPGGALARPRMQGGCLPGAGAGAGAWGASRRTRARCGGSRRSARRTITEFARDDERCRYGR